MRFPLFMSWMTDSSVYGVIPSHCAWNSPTTIKNQDESQRSSILWHRYLHPLWLMISLLTCDLCKAIRNLNNKIRSIAGFSLFTYLFMYMLLLCGYSPPSIRTNGTSVWVELEMEDTDNFSKIRHHRQFHRSFRLVSGCESNPKWSSLFRSLIECLVMQFIKMSVLRQSPIYLCVVWTFTFSHKSAFIFRLLVLFEEYSSRVSVPIEIFNQKNVDKTIDICPEEAFYSINMTYICTYITYIQHDSSLLSFGHERIISFLCAGCVPRLFSGEINKTSFVSSNGKRKTLPCQAKSRVYLRYLYIADYVYFPPLPSPFRRCRALLSTFSSFDLIYFAVIMFDWVFIQLAITTLTTIITSCPAFAPGKTQARHLLPLIPHGSPPSTTASLENLTSE